MPRICADVIDLFARRVVGWATGDRPHKELALSALRRAITVRRPPAGLIRHANRGSQYCSLDHQTELRQRDIRISMSGKGNCYDNAMVETFFKTLKAELVWRAAFQDRAEATATIGRAIDGFCNPVRRHAALDFISPLQFEKRAAQNRKRSPQRRGKSTVILVSNLARSAEEDHGGALLGGGGPQPPPGPDHRLGRGGPLPGGVGHGVTILSDMVYRPWSLEGQRIEVRSLVEPIPSMDIGLAGARSRAIPPPAAVFRAFMSVTMGGGG